MRDDSESRSVAVVFWSVGILAITVAGVLVSDFYSTMTGSAHEQLATEFDPSRYPSPAAGTADKPKSARDCNGVIFRTTKEGIKYVKQAGGGALIGAEYQKEFGFYRIEYGLLSPVERASVDRFAKEKLKYALYNCEGPFSPSGADF